MAVIHISEAEAARDFAGLLARVRAGEEVCIDDASRTIAVIRSPEANPPRRKLSEILQRAKERGSAVTLDDQFGRDLEEIIRSREHEVLGNRWE